MLSEPLWSRMEAEWQKRFPTSSSPERFTTPEVPGPSQQLPPPTPTPPPSTATTSSGSAWSTSTNPLDLDPAAAEKIRSCSLDVHELMKAKPDAPILNGTTVELLLGMYAATEVAQSSQLPSEFVHELLSPFTIGVLAAEAVFGTTFDWGPTVDSLAPPERERAMVDAGKAALRLLELDPLSVLSWTPPGLRQWFVSLSHPDRYATRYPSIPANVISLSMTRVWVAGLARGAQQLGV
jgi:hypothetical protein